jgi:SAM-dependent methyltransferase
VLAVEPSATMRAQRPADAAPCLAASAESLPLDDDSVDAAMACVTIHHWPERARGLAELRRVARGPVVVFTFDLADLIGWQRDYLAPALTLEVPRFGTPEEIAAELGGATRIETIPTPADCADGFFEAFWNRPEALLDPTVRASQSLWQLLDPDLEEEIVSRLAADLESGKWDAEHGALRGRESYEGSLRLVVSEVA